MLLQKGGSENGHAFGAVKGRVVKFLQMDGRFISIFYYGFFDVFGLPGRRNR
jgi:hypothetical protein